ncbi:MAG: ribosomal L7Ae/L30e/S12e/Gadd45 family protein [Christensenellaceae bacterium]
MYDELKNAKNRVVGLKQLLRGLENDEILTAYIADACDKQVKNKVLHAIGDKNIHVVFVDTMKELGQVCGIDVCAACAAIIKN